MTYSTSMRNPTSQRIASQIKHPYDEFLIDYNAYDFAVYRMAIDQMKSSDTDFDTARQQVISRLEGN